MEEKKEKKIIFFFLFLFFLIKIQIKKKIVFMGWMGFGRRQREMTHGRI